MAFKKILIAVDSSEYSIPAAKKGFEIARLLDATVALLYVIDISKSIGNVDAGIIPEEALILLKKEAVQVLGQLASYNNGVDVKELMPEGRPKEDIIKSARAWDADLIVMGTRGRKGLQLLLNGSVAAYIVRHSKIPVLVIPIN